MRIVNWFIRALQVDTVIDANADLAKNNKNLREQLENLEGENEGNLRACQSVGELCDKLESQNETLKAQLDEFALDRLMLADERNDRQASSIATFDQTDYHAI